MLSAHGIAVLFLMTAILSLALYSLCRWILSGIMTSGTWPDSDEKPEEAPRPFSLQHGRAKLSWKSLDASLLKELIGKGQPLRIETASGQAYEVRHRDFVAFSPKQTSLLLWFEENGEEHFALVPLLTVTAAVTKA